MTKDKSISLVNLGELSKPANTLIEKLSSAVGGLFGPWQVERVAKAQAKVDLIKAQSEIQITALHRRAMHRFVEEEAQRQQNMEKITEKAIPQLEEKSDPSQIEDDWVTNFFDKSRIISDNEMQEIWAKVLAGEANAPGTYSKRTVNFLGDLDKSDAELFQNLCSFGWIVGEFTPLIFDSEAEIYNKEGINFASLTHLDSIGLIQFQHLSGFRRTGLPKKFAVLYCGKRLVLEMPNEENNNLPIGKILLTKLGKEIVSVCSAPGVDGFYDYVSEQWKKFLPKTKEIEQVSTGNG
ncbi:DUF2806 domain-containing protein [Synechocystis sp. PCC 7339]|uniref:DUF2806 domain-containing protein n=1 Tax=unclassified Synechocystis TaxID=2640012 RepID=UPI001BB071A7|nr:MULTISPECIES: DUF2806 domain-containing protein [unclassified Synechocystis]QUS59452.1 DUF2806 domain-containing protein [Synechocystis sp. PCC 7338]UAJ71636.1 DUF2806 domain-containing protein [Synechocystis sp. PCC 7339]